MPEALFAPLDPYAADWLDVGDGHVVRYEECGNPNGIPAVFLHGGPGSSVAANHRRCFNPSAYRVVLFDQRGCGQSRPAGETRNNTTWELVDDIERLRLKLGVTRWMLFGGSWGSTLAIAYAQTHPERVSGMVLRGVFLGTDDEVSWFLTGLQRFLPEAWSRFSAAAERRTAAGLLHHYRQRVQADDLAAATDWNAWEAAVMAVGEPPSATTPLQSAALLQRVRVQLHYLVRGCFLAPDQLMSQVEKLRYIPAIVVQGRRDLICPPNVAFALSQRWPTSELRIVEEGGHSAFNAHMAQALVHATQDMLERVR